MIPIEYEPSVEDARVVIGIDFGTTFSGFSFAYIKPEKEKIEIVVNDNWLGIKGPMKTNTVLQYDEDYEDVIAWGAKALAGEPSKKAKNNQPRPVELFKLHLGDVPESKKPKLPDGITPERAITDYLREMGKVIKDEIKRYWSNIDFNHHVRIIVTVPSGFSEKTKSIMRKCLFDAGLIKRIGILSLQFTTEPEAAAIHCMSILKEHGLSTGAKYLIVDCGGGTVDLTVRKLLPDNKLGETTMRSEDFCGGSYVDDQFLEFLEKKVSKSAMDELKEKNYGQVNYMVQQFCFHVKIPFTGEESDFGTFEWDIERKCPALKKYVTGSEKNKLRKDDWIIDLNFKTVKGFFDPVIDKILKLIEDQLKKCPDCSVMFLVGGFSESKYLQTRVKQAFEHKIKVAVPPRPVIAVVSGACEYGLDTKAVSTRVLKWTYGVLISPEWIPGDPPSRKDSNGRIEKFYLMAEKEVQVDVDKEFSKHLVPVYPNQTSISFCIYYTSKYSATYCDEPEMNFLGRFDVDLPDVHLGTNRPVILTLRFGSMEIFLKATNETNGKVYRTTFCSTE